MLHSAMARGLFSVRRRATYSTNISPRRSYARPILEIDAVGSADGTPPTRPRSPVYGKSFFKGRETFSLCNLLTRPSELSRLKSASAPSGASQLVRENLPITLLRED